MIKRSVNIYNLVKGKMPAIVFHSGIIFVFSQAGAVINFITNLLIVPKYLDNHDLGLIAPVTQYVALGTLPFGVVSTLVVKFITKYEANGEWGKLKRLTRDLVFLGAGSTVVVAIWFCCSFDILFVTRLGVESRWVLFWMVVHLCVSTFLPVVGLLTRSMQQFFIIALGGILVPCSLLVSTIMLIPMYGFVGYIVALIASTVVGLLLSFYAIHRYFQPHQNKMQPYFDDCKKVIKKYLVLFVLASCVGWLWGFLPPFIVKHFLSNADAAGYYFVLRLSQLPFYAFSTLMLILLPIISMKHEKGCSTARTVKGTMWYTVISGVIVIVLLYLFMPWMFELVPQWQEHAPYAKYIWIMAINVVLGAVNLILVSDLVAKWVFKPSWYNMLIALSIISLTYCIFGWGAFKGRIPDMLWHFVDANVQPSLYLLLFFMILNNVISFPVNIYWYCKVNTEPK